MKALKLFSFATFILLVDSKVPFNVWQWIYNTDNTGPDANILTFDQFESRYRGLIIPKTADRISSTTYTDTIFSTMMNIKQTTHASVAVPDFVDYRNYTLAVKHQLNCESCWAFTVLDILGILKISVRNY